MGLRSQLEKLTGLLDVHSGPEYKPRPRQLYEIVRLGLTYEFLPGEYYLYGFPRREMRWDRMLEYMPLRQHWQVQLPKLNDPQWVPVLKNKWLFHLHYGALGFPLPRLYGYYDAESGFTTDGVPLRSTHALERLLLTERPPSLVIKPVDGVHGSGLLVVSELRYDGGRVRGVAASGQAVGFDEIADHVRGERGSRRIGYLLEEKLEPHPRIAEINPFTAGTVRVVTLRDMRGDVVITPAGVLRVGRPGIMVDNAAQGGFTILLDPATGRLGPGKVWGRSGRVWDTHHPDTGVRLAGRTLPDWESVRALCVRAAKATPRIPTVGWDIVLTPSGPVLLEGNHDWCPTVQAQAPYLRPEIREKLAEYGLTLPVKRRPVPRLKSVLSAFT